MISEFEYKEYIYASRTSKYVHKNFVVPEACLEYGACILTSTNHVTGHPPNQFRLDSTPGVFLYIHITDSISQVEPYYLNKTCGSL